MDLLSDLLGQAGLQRRLLDLSELGPETPLRFPCGRSIGLHLVRQGPVHLHAPGLASPLRLQAGDLALMARGCDHVLSLQPEPPGQAAAQPGRLAGGVEGDGLPIGPVGRVISGAYQLWNPPLHPFWQQLPGWFVLRADESPRLGPLALAVGLLEGELVQPPAPGAGTAVHGLLDVVFTYLLRELLRRPGGTGWGPAVNDPPVARALALMQADCARSWTLESLAAEAGLSRTGLAQRFRQTLGETPLAHLRTLRLQRAMQLLGETSLPLDQVAQAVGYTDAFSFSKVFKRELGLAPRDYRRRDQQERSDPWRFRAGR